MPGSTIIIGTGISAVAYAATAQREILGNTHAIGGPDLWHSVSGHHAMGQPRVLLTGNVLGGPGENRGYENPHSPSSQGFMPASQFADLLTHHLRESASAVLPGSYVTGIRRGAGWGYEVHFAQSIGGATYRYVGYTENVVIALGAGPLRSLTAGDDGRLEVDVRAMEGYVVGGTEFMSPHWRMPGGQCQGKTVAIYGGSATSAWAVEQAVARGMKVTLWFTRPGRDADTAWNAGTRFSEAFPAGDRNARVKEDFEDVRQVLKLTGVKLIRHHEAPFMCLTFRNAADEVVIKCVDLLVYALGAGHTADRGIRAMLPRELDAGLVAYYDHNFAISSAQSLLAMGTPDRSLMIVGSAMSSAAGFGRDRITVGDPTRKLQTIASYAEISNTLPPAARPTEGIAMVLASVEALNEFIPATVNPRNPRAFDWNINFNTANRTQIAVFYAAETDYPPFVATLAVALIVKLRAHAQHTFGLTGDHIGAITAAADESWRRTIREYPGFEAARLRSDRTHGADRYLESCVDHLTTDLEWLGYWRRVGVLA